MKKTLATFGATILGLAGALGASAAPASATPSPDPCTNALNDHLVNPDVDPSTDNWYMTCIPQYGMGKAEFSITAPDGGFPAGYSLTDGHQTVVSSTPTATQVQSYFNDFYTSNHAAPTYTGAFVSLTEDTGASTATTQVYDSNSSDSPMTAAFPITSVARITTGLPAACTPDGETYEGEYVVNYAPVTTTFSELIGAEVYKTTVTLAAPTLYLGLNFDTSDTGNRGFDVTKPLCATSSAGTLLGEYFNLGDSSTTLQDDLTKLTAGSVPMNASGVPASPNLHATDVPTGPEAWITIAYDVATNFAGNVTTLVPTTSSFEDPDPTPIANGTFAVTATPALAETGVDAAPAGILGGGLLLAGIGAVVFRRRRRTTTPH